jgi:iron(III) transport system ATP-binding protein
MAGRGVMLPAHKRAIGFVPQDGALFPHLSVADNVGFGLERRGAARDKRIRELLDLVELDSGMLDRRPNQLSGGQQQRVALARALARQPQLMLLDEPFSALDAGLREAMRHAVAEILRDAGITTMLVTHDQVEALSFADKVAVLRDGRLVQSGSPRDLYRRPRDAATATFLGDALILPADIRDGWAECAVGLVPAEPADRSGKGQIMLRPDQIRVTHAAAVPDDDPNARYGRIMDVRFGGPVCTVVLSLAGAPDSSAPEPLILLRSLDVDLPAIGSYVRVSVVGKAHVFDAP